MSFKKHILNMFYPREPIVPMLGLEAVDPTNDAPGEGDPRPARFKDAVGIGFYREQLARIRDFLHEKNIPLISIGQVHVEIELVQKGLGIRHILNTHGMVLEAFKSKNRTADVHIPDDGHYTAIAHEEVAEILYSYLLTVPLGV